jgi:hypothetical protein
MVIAFFNEDVLSIIAAIVNMIIHARNERKFSHLRLPVMYELL